MQEIENQASTNFLEGDLEDDIMKDVGDTIKEFDTSSES